jgi:hypothetical protein
MHNIQSTIFNHLFGVAINKEVLNKNENIIK